MDKDLTLAEMLEEHGNTASEISTMDFANLTADNQKLINDYVAVRQLLQRTGESLEFASATTVVLQKDINDYTIASVMDKVDNLNALCVLTNNGDEKFIKEIYKEGLHSDLTADEQTQLTNAVLDKMSLLESTKEFEQAYELQTVNTGEITVAELISTVDNIQALMERENISLDKITEKAEALIEKKFETDAMNIYENAPDEIDTREELKKQDDELVIVEGNDGGVMYTNMTPELAARRPDLEAKFESIVDTSGDYVTHYTVEETTNDMSRVGGDVKYEAVSDVGTIERGQGQLNREEKQTIIDNREDEIFAEQQRQQEIAYQEQLRLEEERRRYEEAQKYEDKDDKIAMMLAATVATVATVEVAKELAPVVAEAAKEEVTKAKPKSKSVDFER